ncbi:glycosyltransferase [Mesonia sp. K4-1]|uniref:glycosyltransferase n=1 Tax=Mesonia sp. K4-1 TaxID=2602760 RepID=UPI0011C78838|nr:glycosyltransferase [Mesonia sp. K4-1]TXK77877.1 glycosyltransferase family 2 protein [Mesonia sp. K4-1]
MKQQFAPVIVFTYNRKDHTIKTLESLARNKEFFHSNIFIYSDGFRDNSDKYEVEKLRKYLHEFKLIHIGVDITIIERDNNLGLERSIINGVSEIIDEFDKVIVLEDDLEVSPHYLEYMNQLLFVYKDFSKVGAITGYNPIKNIKIDKEAQVYFSQRTCSYGWGTWSRIWAEVDWEAKSYAKFKTDVRLRKMFNKTGLDRSVRLDRQMQRNAQSWSVKFGFDLFLKNKLTIYPIHSYLKNIGWDGTGTHNSNKPVLLNHTIDATGALNLSVLPKIVEETEEAISFFKKAYGSSVNLKVKELLSIILNYER